MTDELPNKGMQQTKRGFETVLELPSVIDVRFAADPPCSTDRSFNLPSQDGNGLWAAGVSGLARPGRRAESRVMPRLERAGSEELGLGGRSWWQ
jgi:hypothetical protein